MQTPVEKAKEIIEKIPYITIASVTVEGKPWNSPVFAVHDEKYNFIWNSSVEAQHSKNISLNKNIFIVIYDSSVLAGEGKGVYIEAEAREIGDEKELEQAIKIFYTKIGKDLVPTNQFLSPSPRRMYIATPKKVWINQYDKTRIPPDWKEEVEL